MRISREEIRSLAAAGLLTAVLALLIVLGLRRLSRFDAALVAYTFASLLRSITDSRGVDMPAPS